MSRHDEREAEAYELTDVEDLDEFEQRHKPRQRTSVDSDENDENIALLASDGEVRRDEVVGKGSKVEQLIDSAVPTTDDPTLPTSTFRAIVSGCFFCVIGAAASMVFYFKSNAPSFSTYFVILATYPSGHFFANERFFPRGRRISGITINPGPFSIKEAILVSVISSSGASAAYAADILAILDSYFKKPLGPSPSIVLSLTTQCIGFGLAGISYNVLVARPAMYWPSTLVIVQLFTTSFDETASASSSAARRLTSKRSQVFVSIFIATFIYQFLPSSSFSTLTSVSVLCSVNNQSWVMRWLGSAYTGSGMMDFSFDWASVGAVGPSFTPYWASGNYFGGSIGMMWIIVPILLVFNFWNARDFPSPTSAGLFNTAYAKFDVPAVLSPDLSLDDAKWETAQPILLTPYFAITYGLAFAAVSSVVVHVWMWHRKEIKEALLDKAPLTDTHNKLMKAYREVPHWWYFTMSGVNLVAAILMVWTTPSSQTPVWASSSASIIAAVFLIPIGIVAAVSNTTIGSNVITEFVAGFLMPGKPIGNVTFKCFGYMAMFQSLQLVSDLKSGWYTSIPPREMFAAQISGTVLGALTNYVTLQSVSSSKRSYLDGTEVDPTGQWTGRRPQIFYSASIIWGAVGPARFFAGKYRVSYLGFPLGALVPVVLWWAHRRWPGYKLHKVVFPIICSGATLIPQYPTNIILSGAAVAVFANSYVAKRWPTLHKDFVYVVSSALDAGTAITSSTIYLSFGSFWTWNGPEWWGNSSVDSEHCKPGS